MSGQFAYLWVYDNQDNSYRNYIHFRQQVHTEVCIARIPDYPYDAGQTAPDAGEYGQYAKTAAAQTTGPKQGERRRLY